MNKILLSTIILAANVAAANAQTQSYPYLQTGISETEIMIQNLQLDKAEAQIKKDLAAAKRSRQSTAFFDHLRSQVETTRLALKGTDRVLILDSVVVDKATFLHSYKYSSELGTITMADDGMTTTYTTERGNRMYRPEIRNVDGEQKLQIVSYYKEDDNLTNPRVVDGTGVEGDCNYPFLMSDGMTFYFSARSADGLGNYDLYVTRYDADSDRFYRADNLGFPYNSYANDYMMVIDEQNQIGWFASDRYQPEDKVCIYTFVPNTSRHAYDWESENHDAIIQAASLRSLRRTWTKDNEQQRIAARQRLSLSTLSSEEYKPWEFTFVFNDNLVYHYLSDFHSNDGREQAQKWVSLCNKYNDTLSRLDMQRQQFASASSIRKEDLRMGIKQSEEELFTLIKDIRDAENKIRKSER